MKKSLENYNNICLKKKRDECNPTTSTTTATTSSSINDTNIIIMNTTKQELSKKNLIFKTKFSSELFSSSSTQIAQKVEINTKFKLNSIKSRSTDSFRFNLKSNSSDDSDTEVFKQNKSTDSETDKTIVKPVLKPVVSLVAKTHKLTFDDDDEDDEADLERFKKRIIIKATSNASNNQNGTHTLVKHQSLDLPSETKPIKRKIFSTKRDIDIKNFNVNSVLSFDDLNQADLNENKLEESNNSSSKSSSKRTSPINDSNKQIVSNDLEIQLRNSRKAYECEELGETQAFLDDIFYLMDGLNSKNKLSDRCLCALKLAEMCLSSEFRMNLRLSSEYIKRMFLFLKDSPEYQVKFFHFIKSSLFIRDNKLFGDYNQF